MHTTCNDRYLTPSRKWVQNRFPRQALLKLTNLNLALFRPYLKTRISTPCLTHTHSIPMAPTQNHTSVPSCPHGKPTTRRSDSLLLRSRLPKSWNLYYLSMDLSLNGILAMTQGVRDVPRRSHSIPRAFPLRNPEARTIPTVLYHKPRITGDSCPVHDPVSRSLPPARPGCLRAPHL